MAMTSRLTNADWFTARAMLFVVTNPRPLRRWKDPDSGYSLWLLERPPSLIITVSAHTRFLKEDACQRKLSSGSSMTNLSAVMKDGTPGFATGILCRECFCPSICTSLTYVFGLQCDDRRRRRGAGVQW